jgi:hypothetical protein
VPPHKPPSRSLCPKARLDAVVAKHIAGEPTEKPVVNAGFVALVLNFAVAGMLGIVLKGSRPVVLAGEET